MQRRPAVGAVARHRFGIRLDEPFDALQFAGSGGFEQREGRPARDEEVHNFLLAVIDSG